VDTKEKRPVRTPKTHFEQIPIAAIKLAGGGNRAQAVNSASPDGTPASVVSIPPRAAPLVASLDEMWIQTDLGGFITQLSEKAALLLHVSRPAARGQRLPIFFTDDRTGLYEDMRTVHDSLVIIAKQCTLKPRDRRAISVTLMLRRVQGDRGYELLWTITRSAV
jgi:hypothetical protein